MFSTATENPCALRIAPASADRDPLPTLVAEWERLYAAAKEAEADYNRRRRELNERGVPFIPRVVLAICRSEMDDQRVTPTYAHSPEEINRFYDTVPKEWRSMRETKLAMLLSITERYKAECQQAGLPEAEERWDAAESALAPVELKLLDTAPTSLLGAIAKLRFAVALGWDGERPLGGPNVEDQAPAVRAVAEAIAFLGRA